MAIPVRATSDLFVRYLLGSEENKPVLIDFINAILKDSGLTGIQNAILKNPFNLKSAQKDKESVLDIKAISDDKRIFDVEIQNVPEYFYINRSLYYWSRLYQGQLAKGEEYGRLRPVICINLLNHILFENIKQGHTCFLLKEKDLADYVLTDVLQIHFFEIVKYADAQPFSDRLTKWSFFFKHAGNPGEEATMEILLKDDPILTQAHEAYEQFNADDELLVLYEAREKRLHDEASRLYTAKQQGLELGLEQGLEKAAQKLKTLGATIELIEQATGLTKEQIEKLPF